MVWATSGASQRIKKKAPEGAPHFIGTNGKGTRGKGVRGGKRQDFDGSKALHVPWNSRHLAEFEKKGGDDTERRETKTTRKKRRGRGGPPTSVGAAGGGHQGRASK